MVRVIARRYNDTKKTAFCRFFADTKEEVLPTIGIALLPANYTIEQGSSCQVADGSFFYFTSDGKWVQDTEGGGGGVDGREATQQEVDDTIDDIVDSLHL